MSDVNSWTITKKVAGQSSKPLFIHTPCAEYAVKSNSVSCPRCLECNDPVPLAILYAGELVGAHVPNYFSQRIHLASSPAKTRGA